MLIGQTLGAVERIRELAAEGVLPPPLVDSPKCNGCSLVEICLPDETRALADSPAPARPRARCPIPPRSRGGPVEARLAADTSWPGGLQRGIPRPSCRHSFRGHVHTVTVLELAFVQIAVENALASPYPGTVNSLLIPLSSDSVIGEVARS